MFDFTNMNSKKQGDVGVGAAIGYFASRGFCVSIPLTDSQDYDLVVDLLDEGLKRIQVKTTTQTASTGAYIVGLRTLGGNQSWSGVCKQMSSLTSDYLFVVTKDEDLYFIPTVEIESQTSVQLGPKWERFKL